MEHSKMEGSNGGWAMGVKPTRGHYVKRWRVVFSGMSHKRTTLLIFGNKKSMAHKIHQIFFFFFFLNLHCCVYYGRIQVN